MFKAPWNQKNLTQKLATIAAMAGIFFGTLFLAYAISNLITNGTFKIPNTRGTVFAIDLDKTVEGVEAVPGSTQTVTTSITNRGTEKMYVFVRFDVGTTFSGSPIYSFSADGWTRIEREDPGELLFVYGSAEEPTVLYPEETALMSGALTVAATGGDFVTLKNEDFEVKVTGCAVGGPESEGTGEQLYAEYLSLGGE